jgi:hypothetical protein
MISKMILEPREDSDVISKLRKFARANIKLRFCFAVAIVCFALAVNTAASQTLEWSPSEEYDNGGQTSVAAHPSGLVLEAHQSASNNDMWYHLGLLNGTSVTWGGSQRLTEGFGFPNWPNVAISKEGYVIFVYSVGDFKRGARLWYVVGKINPYGGTDQSVTWLTDPTGTLIDSGFHSSIAINENGVILLTFESGSGGNGLYYRVGHLSNPAGGDYTIQWDSGKYGTGYDAGINTHIALNNLNEVVEVHQVSDNDHLLHYRRGTVSGGTINFGGSQRYDSNALWPAVSLLDSGLVVELHKSNGALYARTGMLSPSNPEGIEWPDSVRIGNNGTESYPAVANDGSYAIGTWEVQRGSPRGLYYSVATIP